MVYYRRLFAPDVAAAILILLFFRGTKAQSDIEYDSEYLCYASQRTETDGDGGTDRRRLGAALSSYEIMGHLAVKGSPLHLPSIHSCFRGIGLSKCTHIPKSWKDVAPDSVNTPFHYNASFEFGEPYCIECCSNTRSELTFEETWRLYCDTRGEGTAVGASPCTSSTPAMRPPTSSALPASEPLPMTASPRAHSSGATYPEM